MNLLKICLGLLLLLSTGALAESNSSGIHQCIKQVCSSTTQLKVSDFLNREKSNHKNLDIFYGKYKSRIESIRLGRQRLAKKAIETLHDGSKIEDDLNKMSTPDLINFLIRIHPWNTKTEIKNGSYTVVAEPLFGSNELDRISLIIMLFERFKEVSPLFELELHVSELNADPRKLLHISPKITIENYVLEQLRQKLSMLRQDQRGELELEIQESLPKLRTFQKQYGEMVFTMLGEIDLRASILLNEIKLSHSEVSLVKKILKDVVSRSVLNGQYADINFGSIFSKSSWERKCRSAYNRALHYSLTASEENRIKAIKSEAFRRAEKTLVELFGKELTEKALSYLNTMDLAGPMTLSGYQNFIENYLSLQEELISKSSLTLIEQKDLAEDMVNDNDRILESICNNWIFEPIRDSVSGNSIILSSFSAKNYEVGLSIAIHELGHAVSIALQFHGNKGFNIDSFTQIRQCLSENYLSTNKMPIYEQRFSPDKLWTEEDWADAFAGYSTRDMNINDMCSFVGLNPEHDFTKLDDRDDDPHSPTFYRILNIHSHMGKAISNQCTKSLKDSFPKTKFRNCLAR